MGARQSCLVAAGLLALSCSGCGTDYEPAVKELEALAKAFATIQPAENGYCDGVSDLDDTVKPFRIETDLPGDKENDPDGSKMKALRKKFGPRVSKACKAVRDGVRRCDVKKGDLGIATYELAIRTCEQLRRLEEDGR